MVNGKLGGMGTVLAAASSIALPESDEDLRGAHVSWFLSLQRTMREGGFGAVRLKYPGVEEEFAGAVINASYQQLMKLCNGEISLFKPAITTKHLVDVLNNSIDSNMLMVLHILKNETEGQNSQGEAQ